MKKILSILILSMSVSSVFSLSNKDSLKFRIVQDEFDDEASAKEFAADKNMEILENESGFYVVNQKADIDGNSIESIEFNRDSNGYISLDFTFTKKGKNAFYNLTKNNIQEALIFDYKGHILLLAKIAVGIPGGKIQLSDEDAVEAYQCLKGELSVKNPDNVQIPTEFIEIKKSDSDKVLEELEGDYVENLALAFYYYFLNEPEQMKEFTSDQWILLNFILQEEQIRDYRDIKICVEKSKKELPYKIDLSQENSEELLEEDYSLYTQIIIGDRVIKGMTYLCYDDNGWLRITSIPYFK